MSNKEFYEKLIEYESSGLITLNWEGTKRAGFIRMNVGKKVIAVCLEILDFAKEIKNKIDKNQFFSQKTLENHLNVSNTYIQRRVELGEYVKIVSGGLGYKFYIKKDW